MKLKPPTPPELIPVLCKVCDHKEEFEFMSVLAYDNEKGWIFDSVNSEFYGIDRKTLVSIPEHYTVVSWCCVEFENEWQTHGIGVYL